MHPADGSMTSWYDDDERANLIAGCPFALLSNTWNDSMPEKLKISSGDSESLAITHDVMATARPVVDLNTGFAFVRNVENSPLRLTVD